MFFHCSLHSYRVMTNDSWRELIGITSRGTRPHTTSRVKWADNDPITAGLPAFVTPIDELYVDREGVAGNEGDRHCVECDRQGVSGAE